jgi:hypothetical protein
MPRRIARPKIGVGRSSVNKVASKAGPADEDDDFADDEGSSVSYWIKLKLWIALHEHKWAAIFYAIFLLIFTLVVLKSQVIS